MKNTIIIYKTNGELTQTVLNGTKVAMNKQEARNVQMYGTIIFDQHFETEFAYERVTVYEYEHDYTW